MHSVRVSSQLRVSVLFIAVSTFTENFNFYPMLFIINKHKENFVILQSIGIIAIKSSETRAVEMRELCWNNFRNNDG